MTHNCQASLAPAPSGTSLSMFNDVESATYLTRRERSGKRQTGAI